MRKKGLVKNIFRNRNWLVRSFWGLKISEHVLITNIINRSLFGIVLGLIFLADMIIMMNALECFLIYEKFIRKILAFLGNYYYGSVYIACGV